MNKDTTAAAVPRKPRKRRDCLVPTPPTNSAVPPHSATPLGAGTAVPRALRGLPTDEDVLHACDHLQVALAQVLASDDEIIVGHIRDAFALLGGKL